MAVLGTDWLTSWTAVLFPGTALVLAAFYVYSVWTFGEFRSTSVRGPRPWPVLGTMLPIFTKGVLASDLENIRKYGKLVGTFEGRTPALIVSDVTVLKHIMVKDFQNFQNRRPSGFDEYPMRKALPRLRSEHWKHTRTVLNPTFSAAKLKEMIPLINQCSQTLVNNIWKKAQQGENIEFKESCGAFAMDVIASTAFGLQIDSQNNTQDPFVKNARSFFTFQLGTFTLLFLLCCPFATWLLKKLKVQVYPKDANAFFVDIINRIIEERQSRQLKCFDFLQLLMDAQVNDLAHSKNNPNDVINGPDGIWTEKGLTREEILAQALLFFLAGYETTATTISYVAYCLATNQHCQRQIIEEIDGAIRTHGRIDSEMLSEMPYLDRCVCEALRLYPPAVRINRICSRDTQIGDLLIRKGTVVIIPIYALHHDGEVWPDPEQYIPDRFTTEAKKGRSQYQWMPFGKGPRHCIGTRLGMTEVKIALIHILSNFHIDTCQQTQIPLKMKKHGLLQPEKGILLRVRTRKSMAGTLSNSNQSEFHVS